MILCFWRTRSIREETVFAEQEVREIYYIGIDIGSTCAKVAVINEKNELVWQAVKPTGWSSVEIAEELRLLLKEQGIDVETEPCVATGYGRVSVPYADKTITEITCHARGAAWIHQEQDIAVIDIGGQDTKIIVLEDGRVENFMMNDKCSAGTGRFLEIMANSLALRPNELCELAEKGSGVSISSMCTVFAESEVISLIGKGEAKENIAYGIVESITDKVIGQCRKIDLNGKTICLTGGLCECEYIRKSLEKKLRMPVLTSPLNRYAGAIGAALSVRKSGT